jgi:hypothetical protein
MHRFLWLAALSLGVMLGAMPALGADRPPHIQRAINRGVVFLKANQGADDGQWHFTSAANVFLWQNVGATALAGLTLLECDVPANDPSIQRAAQVVREASMTQVQTYSLSLSIMFLDRLGEEADVPLIQSMTVRLLGGQKAAGGWTYQCPSISADEVRRLTDQLKRQNELHGGKEPPKKKDPDQGAKRELPKEIQNQLRNITPPVAQPMQQPVVGAGGGDNALLAMSGVEGDNSNTQFAALALWVARRNGMPVEEALLRVEKRFRNAQHPDGGWTYINTTQPIRRDWSFPPAMTCSGLIGLAVGKGVAKDNKDLNKDPNIKAGFTNLSEHLLRLSNVSVMSGREEKGFYFLWSLERVAEVYGIKMIGKTDWYRWASQVLINSQQSDGGFYGEYARGGVDTCFALLMLSRANVAKDLSRDLRGRLKDGIVTLRSGGVGREALENIGKKSADAKNDKGNNAKVDPSGKASSAAVPIEKEDVESHAARLSDELAKADTPQQAELLEKFQEEKGTMYTLAIAGAIPRLSGDAKTKARDALATRFTRMTAATLRQELQDDDPEIRRAATLACAMKDDKSHIPDLIPILQDREPIVGRAAHAALKSLSGKDFGPKTGATSQGLINAVAAWKGWWDKTQEDKNQGK